jgi:hypothetical protein
MGTATRQDSVNEKPGTKVEKDIEQAEKEKLYQIITEQIRNGYTEIVCRDPKNRRSRKLLYKRG